MSPLHALDRHPGVTVAALTLIGVLLFAPVLPGYFLADDFRWVEALANFEWSHVLDVFSGAWTTSVFGAVSQEYRPLWALAFALDLTLWGPNPLPLHVTNLLLHAIVCLLVYHVTRVAPGGGRTAGFIALAFFVVAPVHEEAVGWIAGRGHVLVTVFALTSLAALWRFQRGGRRRWYVVSVLAFVGALLTQELAVAIPALLLGADFVQSPRQRLDGLVRRHAPFWTILVAYLAFRLALFGTVSRYEEGAPPLYRGLYQSLRAVWLGPTLNGNLPRLATVAILVVTVLLIVAPVALDYARRTWDLEVVRGIVYFAGVWPLLATAPLLGAADQRHLYFASVGIAIALGIAGARLVSAPARVAAVAGALLGLLLLVHAALLARGVGSLAANGRASDQLRAELRTAVARSAGSTSAVIVVLPEPPDAARHFWEYALPPAADPLFLGMVERAPVLAAFSACECKPEQWLTDYATELGVLKGGTSEPVYVIAWDPDHARFTTRETDRASFRTTYGAPGSPLLRGRRPEFPTPEL